MSRNRFKVGQPRRSRLVFEELESKRMLAGVPTTLTFITANQSVAAGAVSGTVKVELLDQTGHALAAPAAIVVNLTGTNGQPNPNVTPMPNVEFLSFVGNTPITSVIIPKGASTASFKFEDETAGTATITASSGVLHSALQAESITAGVATHIVIAPPTAQPVVAGIATPISIKLEDQFNNLAPAAASSHVVTVTRTPHGPTYTVTTSTTAGQELTLFSTSPTGQFFATASSTTPITSIVIPKGSTGTTVYYKDTTPGMPVVSVDGAGLGSASETETVTEAASQIVFENAPYTVANGDPFTASTTPSLTHVLTVELKANDGTVAAAMTPVTVTLTTSSATGLFYNAAGTGTGVKTFTIVIPTGMSTASFTYADTTAGSPTLTATSAPLTSGSQTEDVIPAAVTQLVFSPSSTSFQSDAVSPTITVTEEDQFDNPVNAGVAGQPIVLTTNSGTGMFQDANGVDLGVTGTITIQPSTSSAAFTYTDSTVGLHMLTATATGLGVSATMPVTVTAPAPAQITITPPATNTEEAGMQSGVFVVTLEDAAGNAVMATHNVTIDLSSNTTGTPTFFPTSSPPPSITILTGNTSATFTYEDTAAGTPTITATDVTDGFPSVATTTTVTAAAPTQVVFLTSSPQTVLAGSPATITVQLEDQFNNAASAQGSTETVTLADNGGGTFNPSNTLTFTVGGSASQTVTYTNNVVGDYTISFASTSPVDLTHTGTLAVDVVANMGAPGVVNGSFEAPVTASSTQLTNMTMNGWTFGGAGSPNSGVSQANQPSPQSAYFTAAQSGTQAAYMFTGATISQSIVFNAGTYTLSFFAIAPTNINGTAAIGVDVDGISIFSPTVPASTLVWTHYTATFTVAAGSHTIEFLASGGLATEVSIDNVTLS